LGFRVSQTTRFEALKRDEGKTYISTEYEATEEGARLPGPNGDEERAHRIEAAPREGSQAPDRRRRAVAVDSGLTSRDRVRRRAEFERAYDNGARVSGRFMTLFVVPNEGTISRLGVAAGRKLGGAVSRNRAKRLARELFRRHKFPERRPGVDIIIVPRREMLDAPFISLDTDYSRALERYRRGHVDGDRERRRRDSRRSAQGL
jgi:ribonuclease P protein component